MKIKGIKNGVLVNLEEDRDWLDVKDDLIKQIEDKQEFFLGARLILDVGNNVLRAKELGELRDILAEKGVILSGVSSLSLVTQETARLLGLKTDLKPPKVKSTSHIQPLDTVLEGEPAVMIHRTMRSGYKIAYHGHVVVLGDVNPGAEIIASGCVVVWGRLRGTVHAGAEGDEDAVVCALDLSPMQLRIASKVATTPNVEEKPQPEIASIKDDKIIAELWQY